MKITLELDRDGLESIERILQQRADVNTAERRDRMSMATELMMMIPNLIKAWGPVRTPKPPSETEQ